MAGSHLEQPLPAPIIRRPTSPGTATAVHSPHFSPAPAMPAATHSTGQSYFTPLLGPSPSSTPVPSSILLNKTGSARRDESPNPTSQQAPGQISPAVEGLPFASQGLGLNRMASPESEASAGGFSSEGFVGKPGNESTAPSSALGSPSGTKPIFQPSHTIEQVTQHLTPLAASQEIGRSASSSPHCHFAPLPIPEDRPITRRNSTAAGRSRPQVSRDATSTGERIH